MRDYEDMRVVRGGERGRICDVMIKLVLGGSSPRGTVLHLACIITNCVDIYAHARGSRFGAQTALTEYTVR